MPTTTSPPILIYDPVGGVPPGSVSNPPVYSQKGTTQLVAGQRYIDVVFGSVQTTDEWVLVECIVVNEIDVDPLNMWPGIITDKTAAGFRLQLNGMPDSGNYYLHWAISGVNIVPSPATSYSMTGPVSGGLSVASSVFTVAIGPSTTLAAPVVVTPDDGGGGGTFTPSFVTLTTGSPSQTFTYTPASYGAKTISTTNSGPLSNPASIVYTCVSSTYTFSGPSTGGVGVASTDFTVALPVGGAVIGTVTVTPSSGGGGGTFTPSTVSLTTVAPSATFTYTPASGGAKTISVTNNGGLTNPVNLTYTVTVPPAPHLLDTLISYWKMDETGGTAVQRMDSHGSNHLSDPTNCPSYGGANAKINNAVYFGGGNRLTHVSNSSLQVTGDFTFALWFRHDGGAYLLWKGDGASAVDYSLGFDATYGIFFMAYIPGVGPNGTVGAYVPITDPAYNASFNYIVAWYDSTDGKVRLRINDTTTYASAASVTLVQTTNDFQIGEVIYGGEPSGYFAFTGMVDEMGFWKRVLTAQEMTALYNGGAGLPYSSFTA